MPQKPTKPGSTPALAPLLVSSPGADAVGQRDAPRALPGGDGAPVLASQDQTNTRDRILAAARELFHETSYAATGISAILSRAEVNSGSLYHYFTTKEDLLIAVLEDYKSRLGPVVVEPVFARVSDPIERIFALLQAYRCMLLANDCAMGCPIGNLALELSDTHPAVRRVVAENFDNWKGVICGCLDTAADRLRPDIDRDELASFILTTMEGALMQVKAYRSIEPLDAAINQLRNYFNHLLVDAS